MGQMPGGQGRATNMVNTESRVEVDREGNQMPITGYRRRIDREDQGDGYEEHFQMVNVREEGEAVQLDDDGPLGDGNVLWIVASPSPKAPSPFLRLASPANGIKSPYRVWESSYPRNQRLEAPCEGLLDFVEGAKLRSNRAVYIVTLLRTSPSS